jgi:alpha-beta hydrolase superfamily lysophospholipase
MSPRTAARRGWLQILTWIVVIAALLFYGGGGWYFSEQLRTDAFAVIRNPREYRALVTEVATGSVTIDPGDDADADRPGIFGLYWDGGRGTVGEISGESVGRVTRTFQLAAGADLTSGARVDVDPWVYPSDAAGTGLETEIVEYQSPLGAMAAWLARGSDTWAVLVHGKDATPRETWRLASILHRRGLTVLAITHRNDEGQPPDPSGYHRYGLTEWEDLEGAVQWAIDRGADQIVVGGLSTGGATAMSFLEHSELAGRVSALILDAPNVDFEATVEYNAARRTLPFTNVPIPGSLVWVAKQIGAWRLGFSWDDIDYVSRAGALSARILVVHGTDDSTVPIETSRRLARLRPDLVTLVEFEGAEHVQSWNADPERYAQAVNEFLNRLTG